MRKKRSDRLMNAHIFLWCMTLLCTTSAVQDCGTDFITINRQGECTSSSCLGECRNGTCCLERCFEGNEPSELELRGCNNGSETVVGTCSTFANQTACLALNMNKTFKVCWKHTVYFISTHPDMNKIIGFNPIDCPCEYGYARQTGPCGFPQCVNNSMCDSKVDPVLNVDVCCLNNAIFPNEKDCDDNEKLDTSVHKYHNVSTVVDCQEVCSGGPCRMPDPKRLPACCRRLPKSAESPDDSALHGSVIAVIVIIIVILIMIGAFGVFYLYRIKQEGSLFKGRGRKRGHSETGSIEITGIEEMIGGEQAWNEDGAIYQRMNDGEPGRYHRPEEDGGAHISTRGMKPERFKVPGEFDDDSTPVTVVGVHSIERLQNGTAAHAYDNQVYGYDEQSDEESYNSNRGRTGSPASNELESEGENDYEHYGFNDGHSTDVNNGLHGRHSTDRKYGLDDRHSMDGKYGSDDRHSTDGRYGLDDRRSTDGRYGLDGRHSTDGHLTN